MHFYLGLFLIAFATLSVEVALLRLLSAISWYHLAFFAISTAMLGMTAGAVTVYLGSRHFVGEKLEINAARACFVFGLAVPFSTIALCLTPIEISKSVMNFIALLFATAVCSLPFYFSGIAITAVLTKCPLPIGRLYASDLVGASLGCLFVLAGLEFLDAPSFLLLSGSVGVAAGFMFGQARLTPALRKVGAALIAALIVLSVVNASTVNGIRPMVVKGRIDRPSEHLIEKWNSFSRIVVRKGREMGPVYWGPSPRAPMNPILQYEMVIDGDAGTSIRPFRQPSDLEHLRYDVTNVGYYLRPNGGACVIGVGGGRDLQSALGFGHKKVLGVEVNPIFVRLLSNEYRTFAGLVGHPAVRLVVDEARSYLSRSSERFSVIQMSMIDTWAATGAGAFSLSENALYTVEAWKVFLSRLEEEGLFMVSRWHGRGRLGETSRVVSLAVASLLDSGVDEPSRHLAVVATERLATLLVAKGPLSDRDIQVLRTVSDSLGYEVLFDPHHPPQDEMLQRALSASSRKELSRLMANSELNYEPPTDENPYFFNMLRLDHLDRVGGTMAAGPLRGNLLATLTLGALIVALIILCAVTIVIPLLAGSRRRTELGGTVLWSGAAYFALIGTGFMFAEIGLIQRLSVFLGHPTYALGILLFSIILSTGLGSLLSDRLHLSRAPWMFVYPVATALTILFIQSVLVALIAQMITSPLPARIALAVASIFPLGILMGAFFPMGMRLLRSGHAAETPWYWALNGIFGVLSSAFAVFVAIYAGISVNFWIAAACYALIPVSLYFIVREAKRRPATC